ncbi:MAG: DUF4097 family beta strand repeat-containing protein [Saprospiraceae bacterium]|nr:DUF4097 family beta strand repeat-containing protein [Saprospiraceae bacterium]
MKPPRSRISTILIFLVSTALTAVAASKEYERTINKEFDISASGVVGIINKYGNIDIHTWDQGKVKFEVRIRVEARSQEKADETFDRINVDFNDSRARVQAMTEISTIRNWRRWFGDKSDKFQIDYNVYLPATAELDLENRYGDVFVPSMNNRVEIELKYGNIQVEEIGGDAKISLAYAKGSLASAHDATLDLTYSTLRCGTLEDVSIDSKYGRFEAERLRNLRANSSYDDYKIDHAESISNSGKYDELILGTVGELDVDTKYTDVVVSALQQEAELTMKYGSLTLQDVQRGFTSVNIETSYTNVRIETARDARFHFDASTKYCGIKDTGIELYHDVRKSGEAELKGYKGSRDASARIVARMDYGSLSIK